MNLVALEDSTLSAGLAGEAIGTGLAAGKATTLLLELVETDGREGGGAVVLGGVVVDFVNWDGGVDDVRLNGLLLHNRLDGLVDVVVDVLAGNDGLDGSRVLTLDADGLVLKFGRLLREVTLVLLLVVVLEFAVLDGDDLVVVLLRQDLLMCDGLDGGVVVVLVDLAVESGGNVLVLGLVDGLVGHGGGDGLVDGGVVVARLVQEGLDLFLCGVHVD